MQIGFLGKGDSLLIVAFFLVQILLSSVVSQMRARQRAFPGSAGF